jgi:hypothetical protein
LDKIKFYFYLLFYLLKGLLLTFGLLSLLFFILFLLCIRYRATVSALRASLLATIIFCLLYCGIVIESRKHQAICCLEGAVLASGPGEGFLAISTLPKAALVDLWRKAPVKGYFCVNFNRQIGWVKQEELLPI